ncbi:IS630 transposase-related protein [Moraxella equi]|uniref:IS630 transposase-related protein n=1 Tax=Moraxella equi TaxID=60442 RepID=UPI00142D91CE|nr:IS630 transposase-related protein [Moraxella equi]
MQYLSIVAHAIELRQKALAYLGNCGNISKVCVAYNILRSTLYARIKKQEQGDLSCQSGGSRGYKVNRDELRAYVEQNPDAYLHEIAKVFDCSTSTIFYALQSLGVTHKKRPQPTKSKTQTKSKISKTN